MPYARIHTLCYAPLRWLVSCCCFQLPQAYYYHPSCAGRPALHYTAAGCRTPERLTEPSRRSPPLGLGCARCNVWITRFALPGIPPACRDWFWFNLTVSTRAPRWNRSPLSCLPTIPPRVTLPCIATGCRPYPHYLLPIQFRSAVACLILGSTVILPVIRTAVPSWFSVFLPPLHMEHRWLFPLLTTHRCACFFSSYWRTLCCRLLPVLFPAQRSALPR